MSFLNTQIALMKRIKNHPQNVAQVKYEIWIQGGPPPDFQRLFTAGAQVCLRDPQKLQNLPKGPLQLVITTQPAEPAVYDSDEESGMYSSTDEE